MRLIVWALIAGAGWDVVAAASLTATRRLGLSATNTSAPAHRDAVEVGERTPPISIVFFGYLYPPARVAWKRHFLAWMSKLKSSAILDDASNDLTVVVSGEAMSDVDKILLLCQRSLPAVANVTLEPVVGKNTFEYPGIHRVWRKAAAHPDRLLLYFHSKGITHGSPSLGYFQRIVEPWRQVRVIFAERPEVDKLGWSCAGPGWVWFNFWWARASYIRRVGEPLMVTRRHYYEDWLGRGKSNASLACPRIDRGLPANCWNPPHIHKNCYSLKSKSTDAAFSASKAQ